jgi:hypothetical protein
MHHTRLSTRLISVLILGCLLLFSAIGADTPPANGHVNELGRVLILEYHLFEASESRWARSYDSFRRDLDNLYREGFYPVGVKDFVEGKIDLPSGKKPVILTFDDSSPGQMRYLKAAGGPRLDPDCAVGILWEFHRKHSDFPLKAIFFALPEAKQPHKLFGQPEFEKKKLNELVAMGFEIGNHTLWHADLAKYPGAAVQKQLALAQDAVGRLVPGYKFLALSLPMGDWPKEAALAIQGSHNGTEYHHKAIFLVSGGPAPSPFDLNCQFTRLPRIQVTGNELGRWLRYFDAHPDQVYVSDGDPARITVPGALLPRVATARFPALKISPY